MSETSFSEDRLSPEDAALMWLDRVFFGISFAGYQEQRWKRIDPTRVSRRGVGAYVIDDGEVFTVHAA